MSFKLVNTTSNRSYGPVEIFSKIATGHWPGAASKLVQRVQTSGLQKFLVQDTGDGCIALNNNAFGVVANNILRYVRCMLLCIGTVHTLPSLFQTPSMHLVVISNLAVSVPSSRCLVLLRPIICTER